MPVAVPLSNLFSFIFFLEKFIYGVDFLPESGKMPPV